MKFLLFTLLLITLGFSKIPNADNYVKNENNIKDKITTSMGEVDDISYVILFNQNGYQIIDKAEWSAGIHGESKKIINNHLEVGDNYIIYALFNKVYKGFLFFKGGKWSYNFELLKNEKKYWSKFEFKKNNELGLKYWKIFKLTVSEDGYVSISDFIDTKKIKDFSNYMNEANNKFIKNSQTSSPFE